MVIAANASATERIEASSGIAVPAQPAWISTPVGLLVVRDDPRREILERRALDEPRADLRMASHLVDLLVSERPGVTDDHVGDPDLADVVQEAGEPDARAALLVEAELPRGPLRIARDGL